MIGCFNEDAMQSYIIAEDVISGFFLGIDRRAVDVQLIFKPAIGQTACAIYEHLINSVTGFCTYCAKIIKGLKGFETIVLIAGTYVPIPTCEIDICLLTFTGSA